MSTMTFYLTASVRDFMADPQMKKALRAREDRYLANINWLDQDLKEQRHLANINWLDQDLKEQRHLVNINWLDQDLKEQRHLANINWLDQDLTDKLASRQLPQPTDPGPSEETMTETPFKFPNTIRTVVEVDDCEWIISREVIRGYMEESNDKKMFRKMIYEDSGYIAWSASMGKGEGPHRLIRAGDNHKNWKNTSKGWLCPSFHYQKQLYDAMAKREKSMKV
jgi:hypothetical protein